MTDVLRLAEHAAASTDHHRSYTEAAEGQSCPGALEWVADEGTYLMSGGRPPLLTTPHDPQSNEVVYAAGWNPERDEIPLAADTDLGSDDFVEHLHLHEPVDQRGTTLLQLLKIGNTLKLRYLVLVVNRESVSVRLANRGPRQS